jgi:galactokinase
MNTDSTNKLVVQETNPGTNHHESQIISNITRPREASQAIDFSRRTGPDTFKRIRRLMTPDGMQDVVCLVDCEQELTLPSIDHLAWYDMPEQGNCFGARQVTSAGWRVCTYVFLSNRNADVILTTISISLLGEALLHDSSTNVCIPLGLSNDVWKYNELSFSNWIHLETFFPKHCLCINALG